MWFSIYSATTSPMKLQCIKAVILLYLVLFAIIYIILRLLLIIVLHFLENKRNPTSFEVENYIYLRRHRTKLWRLN
jgi:hypothetical protein